MRDDPDFAFAAIADLSARLRTAGLSPVTIVEECLARIETLNPRLNAFVTVTRELALEQARRAEAEIAAGQRRGPLHGVPVAVKDFYDTAGVRTTAGVERFANRVPDRDADMVVRLRDAGAVLVGKTNMHALGMGTTSLDSWFGPVVNPWSAAHVAGGSSGGSAVAIATGMCYATVDTDAVGSGRIPAAICGVTCFKPTFGALSTAGILASEPVEPAILALSHPSIMCRSAADVALAFEAVGHPSDGDSRRTESAPRELPSVHRLGVVTNYSGTDEVRDQFATVVNGLKSLHIEMREVEVPFQAASFDVSRIDDDRAAINDTLFRYVDAIALPTLPAPTPTVDEARRRGPLAVAPDNTFFCNYFGLPAISLPTGVDERGLPWGIQIVGPRGADDCILGFAREYQAWSGWRYEAPPLR